MNLVEISLLCFVFQLVQSSFALFTRKFELSLARNFTSEILCLNMNKILFILGFSAITLSIIDHITAVSIEKVVKQSSLKDEKIEENSNNSSALYIAPEIKPTDPKVQIVEDGTTIPSPRLESTDDVKNKDINKDIQQPVQDKLQSFESDNDELVYADDPAYKQYNLTLYSSKHENTSGSLSATTLLTALGLPTTHSFIKTLVTAYALPNGPTLVEDILSQLLLIDDNLLVNLVQSLGEDALKNQGLTLEEFQSFLLDDDNESMSLLRRLFADAAKGKSLINIESKLFPKTQDLQKHPNFEVSKQDEPYLYDSEDAPIIYTPNLEKISIRKPTHDQSTPFSLNFNKIPSILNQKVHDQHTYQEETQNIKPQPSSPSGNFYYAPTPNFQPKTLASLQRITNVEPNFAFQDPPNMSPGQLSRAALSTFDHNYFQRRQQQEQQHQHNHQQQQYRHQHHQQQQPHQQQPQQHQQYHQEQQKPTNPGFRRQIHN